VERGIASLPTSSKLRVPHIPGVGMWESCKARPFPHPRTIRVPHPGARFFAQQCGTASLPTRSKLRVPHSGARRFSAQQGGIASLPTRSKLRVPHIPGVGMWVSCKARPSCRPKNPLFQRVIPSKASGPRVCFSRLPRQPHPPTSILRSRIEPALSESAQPPSRMG
jgi:hypothetical protein